MVLCVSAAVQRRPERGHFTAQLDPNQRGEADKVLWNRPSGRNGNAHRLQICKKDAEKKSLSDVPVANSHKCFFFFYVADIFMSTINPSEEN